MAKISDLTELTTATDTSEIVINDGTPITKKIIIANLKASLGVPVYSYKGFISQSSTNAPTIVELFNNFGVTPVLTYTSAGTYNIQLTGMLTVGKTAVKIYQGNQFPDIVVNSFPVDVDNITVKNSESTTLKNSILNNHLIEIEVYA